MSKQPRLIAYADGSCLGNPGPGGWGVVLVGGNGSRLEFSGAATSTTNNRMEITAAIEALRRLPFSAEVTIRSDSQYLVNTMTQGWKRRENLDLWKILDAEVAQRKVRWEWVRGHSGDTFNERADELARNAAIGKPQNPPLDYPSQMSTTATGELQTHLQGAMERGSLPEQRLPPEPSALSNEEAAEAENEAEIARLLRPLLAADETLRRCAGCHRAFVVTGNPPRMRAYCSLAACQLKRRRISSS
ncbi:MAG: ribonuclease HI [Deltaproteobacteria bacterium]|nr:ribonuclease HI [Deltaproteobacteria bacterium]